MRHAANGTSRTRHTAHVARVARVAHGTLGLYEGVELDGRATTQEM